MTYQHLTFNPAIARQKPTNRDRCPFCDKSQLGKILDQKQDMIWVENKFPTLENTYQTLIIESDQHEGDISNYSQNKNRQLFAYLLEKWQELESVDDYRSVVLYRNFGPASGGSLRHPHSQIVGFKSVDAYVRLDKDTFTGLPLHLEAKDQAQVTIATKPLLDFTEFNVKVSELAKLSQLADSVQLLCDYLLHDFLGGRCQSYNLFFYHFDQELYCKVVPRFMTSPYLIGYGIHQVNQLDRLEKIREEVLAKFKAAKDKEDKK